MREAQIKMLYEQYGWSPKQIAEFLKIAPTVVKVSIDTQGLEQGTALVSTEPESVEQLKGLELAKQQQFAPIMIAIEMSLLQKINEQIGDCQVPSDIKHLVSAYKELTRQTVMNSVGESQKDGKPAVAIQIVNEVA